MSRLLRTDWRLATACMCFVLCSCQDLSVIINGNPNTIINNETYFLSWTVSTYEDIDITLYTRDNVCKNIDPCLPHDWACSDDNATCISLDHAMSAVCCPTGICHEILPIPCSMKGMDHSTNPTSPIFTTRLGDDLPRCGIDDNSKHTCCPFGYSCTNDTSPSYCRVKNATNIWTTLGFPQQYAYDGTPGIGSSRWITDPEDLSNDLIYQLVITQGEYRVASLPFSIDAFEDDSQSAAGIVSSTADGPSPILSGPVNLFPNSKSSHPDARSAKAHLDSGAIAGISIGVIAFIALLIGAFVILIRKHIAKSTNEYHQTRHFRESRVAALDNDEYTGCKPLPAPGSTVPEMTWGEKIEIEMQDAENERRTRLAREAEENRMKGVYELG